MSNALFDTYATDSDMEVSGKWVYPTGEPTDDNPRPPAFKIARAGGANKKYVRAQAVHMKPYTAIFRGTNAMTPEKLDIVNDVAKKCFFDAILIDWKNVQNKEGEFVPFNRENAEDLMKQLPALFEFLLGEAQAIGTFNPASVEDEAGN